MLHRYPRLNGILLSGLVAAITATAIAGWFLASATREISRGVQFLPSTSELQPNTTFELRFEEAVVAQPAAGLPATESPLVIRPELPGRFVWLSRRSGLYTPSKPPALATAYQFSLRQNLLNAEGKPLAALLSRRMSTPDFGIHGHAPGWVNTNLSVAPVLVVQFNDHVNPATAARYIRFRNAAGLSVLPEIKQPSGDDIRAHGLYLPGDRQAWNDSFVSPDALPLAGRRPITAQYRNEQQELIFPHCLFIKSAQPLSPGKGWKLTLDKGLPNATGKLRVAVAREILLGDVPPFTVQAMTVTNKLNIGKEIWLDFSKILATNLNETTVWQWIALTPMPNPLTINVVGNRIVISGNFELHTNYLLSVRAGLPALEPLLLAQPFKAAVSFTPLAPRLYAPAFSDDQLAEGRRRFELLSVNVDHIQLKAKVFDAQTAVHALRGYRSYFKRWSWEEYHRNDTDRFQRLDYNLVPGQTVYNVVQPMHAAKDQVARHPMSWDTILPQRKYGVVFIQAEGVQKNPWQDRVVAGVQGIVQITDLGMIWKKAGNETWVMVFSYATGQPVPGATVRLVSDENEALEEKQTDAQGVTALATDEPADWLMAIKGPDLHVMHLTRDYQFEIPLYRFDLPYSYHDDKPEGQRALLFSDRSVYRPGEILHLKAIARDWKDGWHLPKERKAKLCLTDPRGRVILDTNLFFSDFGSLELSAVLPTGPLGAYTARLDWPGTDQASGIISYFYVKEFQPNAFEVTLAAKQTYGADDQIAIPVAANYYMGKPLTRAKVHWNLQMENFEFKPEGYDYFQFNRDPDSWLEQRPMDLYGDVELNGKAVLTIPQTTNTPSAFTGHLTVEVTDLNQQTISTEASFIKHRADFYLGFKLPRQVLVTGETVPLEVIAVNTDGTPRPAVLVQARLCKISWRSVAKQGAGRTLVYENEAHREVVATLDTQTPPLQRQGIKWDISPEAIVKSFEVKTPGEYVIELTAKDDAGHLVKSEHGFEVSGHAQLGWNYRNPVQIELVPDKPVYRPGETAIVLVKTPISGPAVVTLERDKVMRSFVTELQGNAPAVRVPIQESDTPNVFVSVMMLRGLEKSPKTVKMPEMRIGYCQLNVPSLTTKLIVAISSSQKSYEPRQSVHVAAEVKDGAGKIAPNTEVTLYAVDEGILSLTGYPVPDPYTFFNQTFSLTVWTCFSLPGLLPEDPGAARFHNKGYLVGGGGEGNESRKNFLPCAFWSASLRTDEEGMVRASFTAPDSLTRYRIIAVAHNARQQFGSGAGSFEISKPLMLTPALPLFAHVGDLLQARAVVHNLTDADGEVEVVLRVDAKVAPGKHSTSVPIKAHGSAVVEFPVTLIGPGNSEWIWQARFNDENIPYKDSVHSTLAVGYAQPLLREILARRIVVPETNLLAGADPRLLEGEGNLTVRIASTRLTEIGEAVEYLLHYPYGCVEQTSSSLLPWLVLQQIPAGKVILDRSNLDREQVLTYGLNRLLSMQTPAGGLAYWPGGAEPMLWASAYGGLTLAMLERAGCEVPAERMKALGDYLSKELRGAADSRTVYGVSDHCLALLTLAMLGRPEPAYQERLFEKRAQLSRDDRAVLALAILEVNGLKDTALELLSTKIPAPPPEDNWFGCPARNLAWQLMAWCRCQPDNLQVDKLVETLAGSQTEGHWGTTQGNAWSLWALVDYARLVENKTQPAAGTLRFSGRDHVFELSASNLFEATFHFTPASNPAPMVLLNPNQRRLYARVIIESRDVNASVASQDKGFAIRRAFHRLDDDGNARELKQPQVGDRILVTLQLRLSQPAHYVAIDDPLPAVFEPINAEFVSQKTALATADPDWFWDFKEVRKDRVRYFRDHLPPGTYTLQHLARVRALGQVTAPSAKVEAMYQPTRFGLSGSVKLATSK